MVALHCSWRYNSLSAFYVPKSSIKMPIPCIKSSKWWSLSWSAFSQSPILVQKILSKMLQSLEDLYYTHTNSLFILLVVPSSIITKQPIIVEQPVRIQRYYSPLEKIQTVINIMKVIAFPGWWFTILTKVFFLQVVEVGFLNRQRSDLRLRSSMPHFTQGPAPSYTGKKDTFNIAMLTLNPGMF